MATKTKKSAKGKSGPKRKAKKSKGLSAKTYKGLHEKRMKSKGRGSGLRIKLKEGEPHAVQFMMTPDEFVEYDEHSFQEDGEWHYVPCVGDDCPLCDDENKNKSKKGYKFLAVVYSLNEKRAGILKGPKTLATQIFFKYKRKKGTFLKRVYDITRMPTNPVSYNFELAEEPTVNLAKYKKDVPDLDEEVDKDVQRFYGDDFDPDSLASSLDDDEDEEEDEEDEEEEDDEDDEEEDEEEDDDEDDDDEDEDPDEEEMSDKDAWSLSDLAQYARDQGVKKTKGLKRKELIRAIQKKRGW